MKSNLLIMWYLRNFALYFYPIPNSVTSKIAN